MSLAGKEPSSEETQSHRKTQLPQETLVPYIFFSKPNRLVYLFACLFETVSFSSQADVEIIMYLDWPQTYDNPAVSVSQVLGGPV